MTLRDSGQDFDPKHRIIGAIVVVTLAVVFIPMVLEERSPLSPSVTQEVLTPAASATVGNKVAITKVTPIERGAVPAAAASPPAAPLPAAPPKEAPPGRIEPKPRTAVTAPAVAQRPASGWVVQVGTFSNAANATRLERKLRADGQTVLAERVELESGKAVRLRVGPFGDRTAALKAQERLQKDIGVKGVVLAYP